LFSPFNHQGLDRECCIDQGTAMTGKGEIIADTITTIIQPMKTNYTHVVNTNDVITPNDLRKTIVNIDSRFRDDHVKQTDMNFTYRLNPQFKNVLRIKLASVEIPNIFYTFADNLGNTAFKVIANNMSAPVVITPGNYAVSDLQTIIQAKLNVATTMLGIPAPGLKITVDGQSGLVTFSSPVVFSIDFTPPSGTNFNASGLGWNLGFKNPMYFNALVFTGESCIDMFGEQYVLFQLNGYNNVEQRMKDKNFITAFAKIILRSSKFTVNYDDSSNFLTKEIIFPQPQNLSLLTVAFRDSYGNIINNNGVTISFALEITEVMNCKLYDYYRNYLIERTRF
jgi:hypothetical protein